MRQLKISTKISSLILFLFASQLPMVLCAQEVELDSIKALVENYKEEDSIRVNLLINLTEYYATRDVNKNLPLINEAISISDKTGYDKGKGRALNALSTYYVTVGELDKALVEALKAKDVLKLINDDKDLLTTHNILARIYNVNKKFDKALEIHLRNIEIIKDDKPSPSKAKYYFYAAKTYDQLNELEKSEEYYFLALSISKEIGFATGVAIAEGSLGGLYNMQGNYNEAIIYLSKTLNFAIKNGQQANIAASYFSLAESYKGLKNYPRAIELNTKAIKINEQLKNYRLLKDLYKTQYELYELTGNSQDAIRFIKLHYAVTDSLFSENKVKVIEDLQTKYETEIKEAEIASLSQQGEIQTLQLKQQYYALVGFGLLTLLVIAGGITFYNQRKIKQKQELTSLELEQAKKRIKVEKQYRESELKAIRSQMNPHFIFNALNSIQEYIMSNEKKLAGKYLGKFADLMRIYLDHSQAKTISVNEEIETLTLYLELEKLRFEDTLEFTLEVDNNVDTYLLSIPTLLIQPYVENALKHGLLHKKENRKLSVSFKCVEKSTVLECKITDNGVGRKRANEINKMRNPAHKSFATSVTKSRLELLNYNNKHKIEVKTVDLLEEQGEAMGTEVIIRIPV